MLVDMEVPVAARLKADNRPVFAVIGTMGPDDPDVMQAMVFGVVTQRLADLFTAAFFALLACAYVKDLGRCMSFFAHGSRGSCSGFQTYDFQGYFA